MFLDSDAWPPAPGGFQPKPEGPPRLGPRRERVMMGAIGLFLLGLFLAPLAGSSVADAIVALVRAMR